MREYCLVTAAGAVVNMCLTPVDNPPLVTEYQQSRGYEWVPLEKVPKSKLHEYYHWLNRP